MTADFNSDLRIDLLLPRPNGPALLLLNEQTPPGTDQLHVFKPGATDLERLRSAQVTDADFDGWLDVVGLSSALNQITLGLNRPRG